MEVSKLSVLIVGLTVSYPDDPRIIIGDIRICINHSCCLIAAAVLEPARIAVQALSTSTAFLRWPRPDESYIVLHHLLARTAPYIADKPVVHTDKHPAYPALVRKHLPNATHKTYEGAKAAAVGQGELKKKFRDPLICINHEMAMCRAHINRLFRRSCNTTQVVERLADHMALFVDHYNR